MAFLYDIRDLHYDYRWNSQSVPVLTGLSVGIPQSSFVCLVGPSGSGKTTLLNVLGFLDQPKKGEVLFENRRINGLNEGDLEKLRLHDLGFVFQSFYLIPTLTVLENTCYFLPLLGLNRKEIIERSEEVLSKLGLIDQRYKRPSEISGGQRQRVAIARALVKKPKVILADEPTANLDRKTSETIISVFKELHDSRQVSFIFSTHDTHLMSYAQIVYRLQDGTIQQIQGEEVQR